MDIAMNSTFRIGLAIAGFRQEEKSARFQHFCASKKNTWCEICILVKLLKRKWPHGASGMKSSAVGKTFFGQTVFLKTEVRLLYWGTVILAPVLYGISHLLSGWLAMALMVAWGLASVIISAIVSLFSK
jgi:hypothetical protein